MWNEVQSNQPAEPTAFQSGIEIFREFQRQLNVQQTQMTKREEVLLATRTEAYLANAAGEEVDRGLGQALRRALGPPDRELDAPILGEESDGPMDPTGEEGDNREAEPESDTGHSFWFALRFWGSLYRIPTAAFTTLLLILAVFLTLPPLLDGHGDGPPTAKRIDRVLGVPSISGSETFDQMVVCRGCHTVYRSEDCFETKVDFDNQMRRVYHINRCTHMVFKRDVGKRCNEPLADMVGGKPSVTSRVFPYLSIEGQLRDILARPDIETALESWRSRGRVEGFRSDVYDGNIWQEFQVYEGEPFLASNGIALLLNTDGFQAVTTRNYTIEAIYLAILNLPRDIRYLRENMILVGLVPGGTESKGLQQFAKPFVDEMMCLWEPDNSFGRRVAVLLVACDVPAARKLGGFSGCTARTEGPRRECHYPAQGPNSRQTFFGGRTDPESGGVEGAQPFDTPFPVRTGECPYTLVY
jgi:hypothetical protein